MNIAPLDSLIDLEIYFQRKYKTTNNETIDYTNVKIGRDPKTCTNRSKLAINYLKYYGEKSDSDLT
jgi:hypothetical protein